MPDDPMEMAVQAKRCRRLAGLCSGSIKDEMSTMARDYETREKAAKSRRD